MIKSATHFIGNSSSCVDLIFTQQPNQVSSGGVHASLHNNCHHQITLSQTSLYLIPTTLPSFDYSYVHILNIRKSISSINWSHRFSDNHLDIQVSIFEECF